MGASKPKVIKDYDKLSDEIREQIKLEYPFGFSDNLISFTYKNGELVSALPFETEDRYYMIRMTVDEAINIIEQDSDFGNDGILKQDSKEVFESKYTSLDEAENLSDETEDFE